MDEHITLKVEGISDQQYSMQCAAIPISMDQSVPGVFLYVALEVGSFRPIFVGETDDLKDYFCVRQTEHPLWQEVLDSGATHVAYMTVTGPRAHRLSIRTDILHRYPDLINEPDIPEREAGRKS